MIKKISLLLLCAVGISTILSAQGVRRSTLRIDVPTSLAGDQIIDEIDNTGTSPWGTAIDSVWEGIPVKYDPNNLNGCAAAGFGAGFFNGHFALIYRGDCEFGQKAYAAQQAGAVGVILVNNLLGVVGMGAGAQGASVTIPVVMVTNEAGNAMRNQLALSNPVVISLTGWRFDPTVNPIDIGIKNDGPILPQGKAMPAHQLAVQTLSDENFRIYPGGRWYNFSTQNFDTFFTRAVITGPGMNDSLLENTYTTTPWTSVDDSLIFTIIDSNANGLSGFDMNDAAVGEYIVNHTILAMPSTYSETGLNIGNNTNQYKFAVTDSIYSKADYNVGLGKPVVNSYIALTANEYEWGPLLYIRNADYSAVKLQGVIMRDIIDDSVFTGQAVTMKIYEWSDNDANGGITDISECTEVGFGEYFLTANDVVPIAGLPITVNVQNSNVPGAILRLKGNTYYWVTIAFDGLLTNSFGIGLDYFADYSANLLNWPPLDPIKGNPLFSKTDNTIYGGGFANAGAPAVALHMSKTIDPVSVNDVNQFAGEINVYPNPSTNVLNVDLNLDKTSNEVSYEVLDITGRSISFATRKNVTSEIFTINTSALANGDYFVKIGTDAGSKSVKFTVAK